MKKLLLLSAMIVSQVLSAQTERKVWVFTDFEIGLHATSLLRNNSMMGDALKPGYQIHYKMGMLHINQFTLGAQLAIGGNRINDHQYFGNFDYVSSVQISPYVSLYIPIENENNIEPYISYDYTEFTAKKYRNSMNFESNGLGLGIDYNYKIANITYLTFGLKYTLNTLNTETHPQWESYLNKQNFLSAKFAISFTKYRK